MVVTYFISKGTVICFTMKMTSSVSVQRNLIDIASLNRNAAHKLKNGSPKFRDVLRKRCRERIKGNRSRLFDKLRNLSGNSEIDEIIKVLDSEENLSEELYATPITEEEESIIAEYEAFLTYEEAMLAEMLEKSMEDEVICPFCQKCALIKETVRACNITCCGCYIRIPTSHSLSYIRQRLQTVVDSHSNDCYGNPQFHMLSEDGDIQMCMTCQTCSYMDLVF